MCFLTRFCYNKPFAHSNPQRFFHAENTWPRLERFSGRPVWQLARVGQLLIIRQPIYFSIRKTRWIIRLRFVLSSALRCGREELLEVDDSVVGRRWWSKRWSLTEDEDDDGSPLGESRCCAACLSRASPASASRQRSMTSRTLISSVKRKDKWRHRLSNVQSMPSHGLV